MIGSAEQENKRMTKASSVTQARKIMLIHANKIVGCEIDSSDGSIGSVDDILFDEQSWTFRYVVADVGQKLQGRQVLLSFETITHIDEVRRQLHIPLTMQAIEQSPDVSTQSPVSVEAELLLSKYWQWTSYWSTSLPRTIGQSGTQGATNPVKREVEKKVKSHLRSVGELEGYHIAAPDGDIGHLKDVIVDDSTWHIQYLVVNAGSWLFQRRVLIPCSSLENIPWADRRMHVSMLRTEIKNSPEYNPAVPIARDYEQALHDHYRQPPYWQTTAATTNATSTGLAPRQEAKEPDPCAVVDPMRLK